jgi:hypothetical protein
MALVVAGGAQAWAAPEPGRGRARIMPVPSGRPVAYRVFATREGLVGGTTANGHVITRRDHFAALPTRRGLSTAGHGERTVRVCTDAGVCAYAPVWDVGPWNVTDDYWNPVRQIPDPPPRGVPAAQAAFLSGYRGGRDGFGRQVTNPAGIDLADGTFRDDLGLTDNAWVTVTFLWTGAGRRGRVLTGGPPLNLRAAPTPAATRLGAAAEYAEIPVECQVRGQPVTGTVRSTDLWDRVAPRTYVSHAYVAVPAGFTAPHC